MIEDQAEIVASAAQQGVDGIAARTGEKVAIETAIDLHVTDHRFDGAASAQFRAYRRCDATALTGDEDTTTDALCLLGGRYGGMMPASLSAA